MTETYTTARLNELLMKAVHELDQALADTQKLIHEAADADDVAKLAWANAYLTSEGTVAEREARATKTCHSEQKLARVKNDLVRHGWKVVDSKRQIISAVQTLAAQSRSEAQLAGRFNE